MIRSPAYELGKSAREKGNITSASDDFRLKKMITNNKNNMQALLNDWNRGWHNADKILSPKLDD